jgi:hypothetical protein
MPKAPKEVDRNHMPPKISGSTLKKSYRDASKRRKEEMIKDQLLTNLPEGVEYVPTKDGSSEPLEDSLNPSERPASLTMDLTEVL